MKKYIMLFASCMALLSACKKSTDTTSSPPNAVGDDIKNTEWVGILDGRNFEYPPPCALKFHDNNTFTMYSHFVLFANGVETRPDSINGTIQAIDKMPDGRTRIAVTINTSYLNLATEFIYITDGKKMMGVSSDPAQPPTFQLERFPSTGISVFGTHWRGPQWHSNASAVSYAYPDLTSIHFLPDGINTSYSSGNQPVYLSQNTPLQHTYQQIGARVYMSGYNILPSGAAVVVNNYFGVLLPSGNEMLVDSNSPDARLPNYLDTNEPYGPNGRTPEIYKY